jgi:general stress protein 26
VLVPRWCRIIKQRMGNGMKKIDASTCARFQELIRGMRGAMLSTIDAEGQLANRPVAFQEVDFEGSVWCLAADDGAVGRTLIAHPMVTLSFFNAEGMQFVSVSGQAVTVRDAARVEKLWEAVGSQWFPEGPRHSRLALIRLDISHAEYWDAKDSMMVTLFSQGRSKLAPRAERALVEYAQASAPQLSPHLSPHLSH